MNSVQLTISLNIETIMQVWITCKKFLYITLLNSRCLWSCAELAIKTYNIFCSQTIINYNINTIIKLQILSCKNLSQTTSKSVQSVILFLYRVPNVENSNIVIKADLNRQTFMKYWIKFSEVEGFRWYYGWH